MPIGALAARIIGQRPAIEPRNPAAAASETPSISPGAEAGACNGAVRRLDSRAVWTS
jgi:hypothetical protein